jgi:hypothetical protein
MAMKEPCYKSEPPPLTRSSENVKEGDMELQQGAQETLNIDCLTLLKYSKTV